ncbi:MAG: glucose-1-phosphate thymidylyltransferase [Deltaproteobacteria bacterium RBG_13_65_10]|nr:MAG: glucose-1-phosphate thymidylyltransferase [Deltaproteobacteria bacterium RBG_13_65_10]
MKGLILSGGKGTRLRPITYTSAKQLVPVANKPILFYGIEAIRDAGIREIGIVVGETAEEIRAAVGNGSRWDVSITYIHQSAPLGLAHAVLESEPFLRGSAFVMYLGDNLIQGGIKDLVREFTRNKPESMILLTPVADPTQFGVAELQGERVVRLDEKPARPRSNLALVGVYMFNDTIFEAARAIRPSARGELEITDAIQWLIDSGFRVDSHIVQGWWKDTGKLEDMLEANRLILDLLPLQIDGKVDDVSRVDFKVVIEEGAEVVNSTIRGPAIIAKGSRIVDSYIGPFTSIAENCTVQKSEIEHSIVLDNSSIVGISHRIVDSLIGRNVELSRSPLRPVAYRFMLGDNSKVGIL